ncbi:MAG: TlyA family RNA methyltransferase [Hyphomicrobiales bacterium]
MSDNGELQPFARLDQLMVERGIAQSRSRAADAVSRGTVMVDGEKALKPAQKIAPSSKITIDDPASEYVSRAALKLINALDEFNFDPSDCICLDIGCSTGGFTQVLAKRGASHIFAVDVGHDQFHPSLSEYENVTLHEGLNIRDLEAQHVTLEGHLEPAIGGIVCDVSFISLKLALPAALKLASNGTWAAILVKPQFEVGKEGVGRGGIVREEGASQKVAEEIADWLAQIEGWEVTGLVQCPITGGDGNQEYMLGARFSG